MGHKCEGLVQGVGFSRNEDRKGTVAWGSRPHGPREVASDFGTRPLCISGKPSSRPPYLQVPPGMAVGVIRQVHVLATVAAVFFAVVARCRARQRRTVGEGGRCRR